MKQEQITTKSEQEQKLKMPSAQESIETLPQEILVASEKEVGNFENEGQQGLESLKHRASSEELTIDNVQIGELKSLDEEAENARIELSRELQDFSKRYSPLRRSEVASEIWQLRKKHRERKKQTEQQNIEIQGKRSSIEEEIEVMKGKVERIEKVIAGFEESVRNQKSKVWHKITNLFKKEKLDDEKMLEIAQDKLSAVKEEIQERFRLLDETQEIIIESSGLEEARAELRSFYNEQSEIKSRFEEEREQRDVKKISQEKGIVFLHGLPLEGLRAMNNTSMNNPGVKTTEIPEEEKLKMILGLEPTLSSSAIRKDEALDGINTMYPFGVILNGGQVLSAHNEDASTLAQHIYNRKTKNTIENDEMFENSSIQSDVPKNVDAAVKGRKRNWNYDDSDKVNYNEIIVESPNVSGFYLNVDFTSDDSLGKKMMEDAKEKVQHFCRQFQLPAYGMCNGKMYEIIDKNGEMTVDFSALNNERSQWQSQSEISLEEVMGSGRIISDQEKLKYANSVIENNPFAVETKHKENFDGLGYGRVFYDYVKRLERGERVNISCRENERVNGGPDVFLSSGDKLGVSKFVDNGGSNIWDRDGGITNEDGWIRNFGFNNLSGVRLEKTENQENNLHSLLSGVRQSIINNKEMIEKLRTSQPNATKIDDIRYWKKNINSLLFFTYGFAEEAKKDGDTEVYDEAMAMVQEFGSVSYCESFVGKRVGEDGKFQILEEDIPVQVRKRVGELKNAQDNESDLEKENFNNSKETAVIIREGFPVGIEEFKIANRLGGSSGVVSAEYNGEMFAIKKARTGDVAYESEQFQDQLIEEYIADKIYESMGFVVPESAIYQGGKYKVSKFVNGKDLGQREYSLGMEEQLMKSIKKGFVLDCLLANWDVIGEGEDNIKIGSDGNIYRMDNGGAMRFRARGKLKGEAFGASVGELETLKNSKWFKDITDGEIKNQIDDIVINKEKILSMLDGKEYSFYQHRELLKKILSERIAYLEEYGKRLNNTTEESTEMRENIAEALDRKTVEKKFRIAQWIQRKLEDGKLNTGNDLVEIAKQSLPESGVELIRKEFGDKNMDYISNFIEVASENKRRSDEKTENLDIAA